jgi:uncharacterized glyoxalase superfamily protein PhnB
MAGRPAVIPVIFYKDPIAALRWLEGAFGFETTSLVVDAEGKVGHSEMDCLGSPISIAGEFANETLLGPAAMKSPASLGGAGTQFLRVSMPEGIDAHFARAKAAGARITQEPADQFYGSRTYRALDPEGHVWNFDQPIAQPTKEEMSRATGLTFHSSLAEAGRS